MNQNTSPTLKTSLFKKNQQKNNSRPQSINNHIQFSNIRNEYEMEDLVIGQPVTNEGVPIVTPLIQINPQHLNSKIQTPHNHMRFSNQHIQTPRSFINPNLGQIRAEQFPDSDIPQSLFCFRCNKMVISNVKQESGCGTYSVAAALCVLFFPCAIIPFIDKSCKDYVHSCRECNTYLGKKVFLCRLC